MAYEFAHSSCATCCVVYRHVFGLDIGRIRKREIAACHVASLNKSMIYSKPSVWDIRELCWRSTIACPLPLSSGDSSIGQTIGQACIGLEQCVSVFHESLQSARNSMRRSKDQDETRACHWTLEVVARTSQERRQSRRRKTQLPAHAGLATRAVLDCYC